MNNLLKLTKRDKKILNRLLEAVNFSFDILVGLKWRKIYWVLKKASNLLEWEGITKSEIKLIAKSLSSDSKITKNEKRKAVSLIVKLKEESNNDFVYESIEEKQSLYVKWFFDLKQVFIC